jgi:hypothetical protein
MKEMYKVGDPTITKAEASNFISWALFPEAEHRLQARRISDKIKRAQLAGVLPSGKAIPADLFFGWAIEQPSWASLSNVPGLIISTCVYVEGVEIEAAVAEAISTHMVPYDYKALRKNFVEASLERDALKKENALLHEKLREIEDAKKAISERNSENGKTGGRGNEK